MLQKVSNCSSQTEAKQVEGSFDQQMQKYFRFSYNILKYELIDKLNFCY